MTDPVTITLLGEPVPWARARLTPVIGGRGFSRPFTPAKQRNNAATLRMAACQAMAAQYPDRAPSPPYKTFVGMPFDCAVRMDVHAEFAIPKSWSKRNKNEAIIGIVMHSKKPDIDNIVKQIKDALQGIVYRDDALVAELHARKRYGVQPKLVITVTPI